MNSILLIGLLVFVATIAIGAVMWQRRPKAAALNVDRERTANFASRMPPD